MSETEMTTTQPTVTDLRSGLMLMNPELMPVAFAEHMQRRKTMRDLIRGQLTEGTHFGYPPGCEPPQRKMLNNVECFKQLTKDKDGKWQEKWIPVVQWSHKPSLYKAGAEFVVDLMHLRSSWESDLAGWEQLGKPKETFVRTCKVYSRSTGELIGEGTGCRRVGERGMSSANAAIKMADKSALVAAVLNAYGLSDLFTQDTEDEGVRPGEAPDKRENAPEAKPRGRRVALDDVKAMHSKWMAIAQEHSKEAFRKWVWDTCGVPQDKTEHVGSWSVEQLRKCLNAIASSSPPGTQDNDEIPY